MELKEYISTGIIESYLLGIATKEEEVKLQLMRQLFPELETEIEIVEGRMERAALDEAVLPPVRVWEGIRQRLDWESTHQEPYTEKEVPHQTNIFMQPKDDNLMLVHKSWKYILITVFALSKIFLIGALYYYFKTQSVEEKLHTLEQQQTTISSPK